MAVLANRHISNIGGCPVCKNGAEDIKYVIFTCDRAKAVWSSLGVWEKILEVIGTDRSRSVIIEEVLRRGETVDHLGVGFSELILTGGWYLWWERRQLVHGENIQ